jgi:hypothetical protein
VFFGVLSLMLGAVLIWGSVTGKFSSWYGLTKEEMEYALYLGLALCLYGFVHAMFYSRRKDADEQQPRR